MYVTNSRWCGWCASWWILYANIFVNLFISVHAMYFFNHIMISILWYLFVPNVLLNPKQNAMVSLKTKKNQNVLYLMLHIIVIKNDIFFFISFCVSQHIISLGCGFMCTLHFLYIIIILNLLLFYWVFII